MLLMSCTFYQVADSDKGIWLTCSRHKPSCTLPRSMSIRQKILRQYPCVSLPPLHRVVVTVRILYENSNKSINGNPMRMFKKPQYYNLFT
jgi:hypothetical protein